MELWDLYDEDRNIIGTGHIRGKEIPNNAYHLCVHVWIRNNKGQYIISQRDEFRETHPLEWECVGGSVVAGEDSLTGAIREAQEEVGVNLNACKHKLVFTKVRKAVNGKKFNDILDVWLFEYNGELDLTKATTKEVAQVNWLYPSEIKELITSGKFVHTLSYFESEVEPCLL